MSGWELDRGLDRGAWSDSDGNRTGRHYQPSDILQLVAPVALSDEQVPTHIPPLDNQALLTPNEPTVPRYFNKNSGRIGAFQKKIAALETLRKCGASAITFQI